MAEGILQIVQRRLAHRAETARGLLEIRLLPGDPERISFLPEPIRQRELFQEMQHPGVLISWVLPRKTQEGGKGLLEQSGKAETVEGIRADIGCVQE